MLTEDAKDRNKVVRIEYEYADGTVRQATGDDAHAIDRAITDAFAMRQVHGMAYNGPSLQPVDAGELVRLRDEVERLGTENGHLRLEVHRLSRELDGERRQGR